MKISIDLEGLNRLLELPDRAHRAVQQAVSNLTKMGHAKAVELAAQRLHVRRQPFVDGLSMVQVDENTWLIQLDAKVRWIDDGMEPHSMIDDLLKSPKAKTAKDGSKYMSIPFRHGPAQVSTPVQMDLVSAIKAEMKKKNIPWGKVETGADGKPRQGRLHTFDVMHRPLKSHEGPGQGWGPRGDVRQGPNERQAVGGGPGGGGTPFGQGVAVYQRTNAAGKTRRDIMTFRTVSSKHIGFGRWEHPGLKPAAIFDAVYEWLIQEWEKSVAPALTAELTAGLD
jgi:hypothetical protein